MYASLYTRWWGCYNWLQWFCRGIDVCTVCTQGGENVIIDCSDATGLEYANRWQSRSDKMGIWEFYMTKANIIKTCP